MTARPDHVVAGLRWMAERFPERAALIHLGDGSRETERLTYRQLAERVGRFAALLRDHRLAGAPVIVATAAGPDYAVAVLACFFAGAIAVPMPELQPGRTSRRWDAVLKQLRPAAVIASDKARDAARRSPAEGLEDALWLSLGDATPPPAAWPDAAPAQDAVAFVQFTSGSTGSPKGVVVTHAALAANRGMIRAACGLGDGLHSVTWLPPWHDMGLVGALLHHLADGLSVVTIPPLAVVQRPIRWLRAIQTYRAAISGGPAFGYANCVARVGEADRAELDLACWRLAYCGAEPVRAAGLRAFGAMFGPSGFDPAAFAPCYGLAEATLFATGIKPGIGRVVAADGEALGRDGSVRLAEGGRELVSCGRPQGEGRIAIAEPGTGAVLPEGRVGEVIVAGPHLARGYWDPAQDEGVFVGAGEDRRLRTGDLGFLLDGDLFLVGRLKHVIVVRGVKHHAEDIEHAATAAHPALSAGGAVAFAVDDGAQERTTVVVEVARARFADLPADEVEAAIRASVLKACGFRLDRVVLVRQGGIPRTTSGKVERQRAAQDHLADTAASERKAPLAPAVPA